MPKPRRDAKMSDAAFLELCESAVWPEVEKALANGANAHARDEAGRTALMRAAIFDRTGIVAAFLDAGLELNAAHAYEKPPLTWAVSYERSEIVAVLLAAGASNALTDNEGHDALWHLRESRRHQWLCFHFRPDEDEVRRVIQLLQAAEKMAVPAVGPCTGNMRHGAGRAFWRFPKFVGLKPTNASGYNPRGSAMPPSDRETGSRYAKRRVFAPGVCAVCAETMERGDSICLIVGKL